MKKKIKGLKLNYKIFRRTKNNIYHLKENEMFRQISIQVSKHKK